MNAYSRVAVERVTRIDQPEGLAAASIGWSAEEFGVDQVSWDYRFDSVTNRYILRLDV